MPRSRSKPPESVVLDGIESEPQLAERGAFGDALKEARVDVGNVLGCTISRRLVAEAIRVTASQYRTWENGRMPHKEVLDDFCRLYVLYPDIVENLKTTYNQEFRRPAIQPIDAKLTKSIGRRKPQRRSLANPIKENCAELLDLYYKGDVARSWRRARALWKQAQTFGASYLETRELALVCARICSQSGMHLDALRIVGAGVDLPADLDFILLIRSFALGLKLQYRAGMISSCLCAEMLDTHLVEYQPIFEPDETERLRYEAMWQEVIRMQISVLTESIGAPAAATLSTVHSKFEEHIGNKERPADRHINELYRLRMTATLGDPNEVTSLFASKNYNQKTIGLRALSAHTHVIALFRAGDTHSASRLAKEWAAKCRQAGMLYKAHVFDTLAWNVLLKDLPGWNL
ncbi:MAG: helix-turn-helix domain-containing protein [Fimbriimonadaceae bacterium]